MKKERGELQERDPATWADFETKDSGCLPLAEIISSRMVQSDPLNHLYTNFKHILRMVGEQMEPDKLVHSPASTHCLTGIPHPFGNMIIAGEQTEEEFKRFLEKTESWVAVNKAPVIMLVFPNVGLPGRVDWATERGWMLVDTMPGMWMEMEETAPEVEVPEGTVVLLANTDEGLRKATAILEEGYPAIHDASDFFMRGIHLAGEVTGGDLANFIVEVDGDPAACSSVCIKDGVAGVYCVATLKRFRGRGHGGAATRAAMRYAHERGIRHALLHASVMGESVYRKIGFEEMCQIPILIIGIGGE